MDEMVKGIDEADSHGPLDHPRRLLAVLGEELGRRSLTRKSRRMTRSDVRDLTKTTASDKDIWMTTEDRRQAKKTGGEDRELTMFEFIARRDVHYSRPST